MRGGTLRALCRAHAGCTIYVIMVVRWCVRLARPSFLMLWAVTGTHAFAFSLFTLRVTLLSGRSQRSAIDRSRTADSSCLKRTLCASAFEIPMVHGTYA